MKNSKAKKLFVLMIFVLVATLVVAACKTEETETVDLKLAELKAGNVTLVETNGKYATTVDYEVGNITISAIAKDSAATVEGTGDKTLKVGKNDFTVTVKGGGKSLGYKVEITRAAADLGLKEVKIGNDTLTAGADGVYEYEVANPITTINLAATAVKSYATVEGVGEKTLEVGENLFTLTVKAGESSKTYTVKVVRGAVDLTLKELKIGDAVVPASEDGTYRYGVNNEVTEVTIAAAANNENATVTGDGLKQNLATGENRFEIEVSADGKNAKYVVVVTRAKSGVNAIDTVKVNGNAVEYDSDENAYLATINGKTATVEVTLASEAASYVISPEVGTLEEGENEFNITVTAENGATAVYTLVIKVVLPTYNVTYSGDVENAVLSEGFTYKHGEKQTLNISLAEKYSQSYGKITVKYKVGDGEAKTVVLDENYGFTVPAEEATGDILVTVTGIEINVYTITYHRDGNVTSETVAYGENATKCVITPNTETKEVIDGYTYSHYEKWVTEENGIVEATFENVTENKNVYYKDEILVRSEVAYYAPMDGLVTYYTVYQMNDYVKGDENGDVEFKVLIKSLATDGSEEAEGRTSFVIYGTAVWNADNELGVAVSESDLNKWFTVKATAADKKVTVYNPDGTVAAEKVFAEYAADTISFAIHANAAVAAVNPTIPELCTITYSDENGVELHREKVVKGSAAAYEYTKGDEDLGEGYTKRYVDIRWLDDDGKVVDLSSVTESVSVKLGYDIQVIKSAVVATSDTKLVAINKYVAADKDGKIIFRVRVNDTGWAGFNVIAAGGYLGISGGVSASPTWYVVTIDTATGEIVMTTEDGAIKGLDKGNYNPVATTISDISVSLSDGNLDLAAVNLVDMEFYDADKTTLLKTDLVVKGNLNYVYSAEADGEGYSKSIDSWLPISGSDNKVYAAKVGYMRNQTLTGQDVDLLATNKYATVGSDGKITFRIRIAQTGWTALNVVLGDGNYIGVTGGLTCNGIDWLTVTIDTANGDIVIANASGTALKLDMGNHKTEAVSLDNVRVNVTGATYDILVIR